MAEIKLGNKYECFNCSSKFYDLAKGSAVCPKCGADQKDAASQENPLVSQSVRRRRRAELVPEVEEAEDDAPEIEAIDDEEGGLAPEDLEIAATGLAVEEEDEEEEADEA